MSEKLHVTVVGAGVIGTAIGVELLRDGHHVVLVDPEPPGSQTSSGNAGGIGGHSVLPQARPGIARKIPGWLADPAGPLSIRRSYLPALIPWLLRFVAASRPRSYVAGARALAALYGRAVEAHLDLAEACGLRHMITRNGALTVFETEKAWQADVGNRAMLGKLGVEHQVLTGDEVREMEPDLTPMVGHALYFPNSAHCIDPQGYVEGLAEAFTRQGGRIERRRVTGAEVEAGGPRCLYTDQGELPVERVVVAAGAWSCRLVEAMGDRALLESERGYHMTLPDSGTSTRHPVMFSERKVMATPMVHGLRVAGTAEFGGLNAKPNWDRADRLLTHARQMFPQVVTEGATRWNGHRPAMPDSLPVIGHSPSLPRVYYAFGHGHLGLTGAAITARLIAQLMSHRPTTINLEPFRIDRF